MRRFIAQCVLGATALALGAGLVTAAPASAQPRGHCYASTCNGKDPESTGCAADTSDNQTWTSPAYEVLGGAAGGEATLYLRYSPLCNSNWARLFAGGLFPFHSLWVQNQNGTFAYLSGSSGSEPSTLWSAMVDGSVPARACVDYWQSPVHDKLLTTCTPWF